MATPPSQKTRQVGFWLSSPTGLPVLLDLFIRPEDLTRQEPSRLAVQQTLGGAWADSWDRGISTITIAGHCGWRGGNGLSGEAGFAALRDVTFAAWHSRRAAAIKAGTDPNLVTLTFMDSLDSITALVAPQSFQLHRSKSSPLLMRYAIQLLVLDDTNAPVDPIDAITDALNNPLRFIGGITGIGNTILEMQATVGSVEAALTSIPAAVSNFVNTGISLLNSVTSIASAGQGVFNASQAAVLDIASQVAVAGRTAFGALGANDALPASQLLPIMTMTGAWNDAACTLGNCFTPSSGFADYTNLYGASACSSTGGGLPTSPYANSNTTPFDDLFPPAAPLVTVTPAAAAALHLLQGDPILLIGNTTGIAQAMQAISGGIKVAA